MDVSDNVLLRNELKCYNCVECCKKINIYLWNLKLGGELVE